MVKSEFKTGTINVIGLDTSLDQMFDNMYLEFGGTTGWSYYSSLDLVSLKEEKSTV